MGESNIVLWVMLIVTLVVILGSVLTAILLKRREKHKNQEGKSDDESPRENIIIHTEGEPIPQYEVKINKSDDDSKEYGHAILTFVDIWRILWIILAILGLLLFINDAITGTIYLTMLIGQPLSMILFYGIGRGLVLLSQIRNELRKMNKK